MATMQQKWMTDLLKRTSRSFYLTLRVLPKSIRPQISLAYLLARTTDTIADTELVPVDERLRKLQVLRERISGQSKDPLHFGELARNQASSDEGVLLIRCEASLEILRNMDVIDQKLIAEVLNAITSGQELDLSRFANASEKRIIALQSDDKLDDYTYRVAGSVGEFWTRICRMHVFPDAALDDTFLLINGIRFGKGLQMVNILRDLPVDLRKGRCYLPSLKLAEAGLTPQELLYPTNEIKLREIYNQYLDIAESHLAAGWEYTKVLPWRYTRVRLACAWPILIGLRTIERLRKGNPLDPDHRIKVNRAEVWNIIVRSIFWYPMPPAWQRMAKVRTQLP